MSISFPAGVTKDFFQQSTSADDKLIIVFFFPENRIWHLMEIASSGQYAWNVESGFLEKIRKIS